MAHTFTRDELPHWSSTRDTRDRLDLVTENVPVPASRLRADRIRYHPGDSAAPHYHVGCDHVFVVLRGSGMFHAGGDPWRLTAGMAATVEELEVHWFENDTDEDFVFVEYWAPFPVDTVWSTPTTYERGNGAPEFMAQVIEDFAAEGATVDRMTARLETVGEVVATDETLVYVLDDETVVWLAAGERYVFDPPVAALVARAVP